MGNCETQYDDNIIPEMPSIDITKDMKNEHRLHQIINNVIISGDKNRCAKVENGMCIADFILDKNEQFRVENKCGMTLDSEKYGTCDLQL